MLLLLLFFVTSILISARYSYNMIGSGLPISRLSNVKCILTCNIKESVLKQWNMNVQDFPYCVIQYYSSFHTIYYYTTVTIAINARGHVFRQITIITAQWRSHLSNSPIYSVLVNMDAGRRGGGHGIVCTLKNTLSCFCLSCL